MVNKELFINRELSWLDFDKRVLGLSIHEQVPYAERFKFSAIYASNLDEFFMVRIGSLYDQTLLKSEARENKTGMTAAEQLEQIMPKVKELQKKADKYYDRLISNLDKIGYNKIDFNNLEKKEEQFWKKYFYKEVYPILSPQIVDRHHTFPFLRNLETYIGLVLKTKENGNSLGIIPISNQFDRIIYVTDNDKVYFALVEELVLHFVDMVFDKFEIKDNCLFRVTRNADIDVTEAMFDQDLDYRSIMSELLKKRRKLAAVRLQIFGEGHKDIKNLLCEKLPISEKQCFEQKSPLDMQFCWKFVGRLAKENKSQLFYPSRRPITPPIQYNLTNLVQNTDVLLAYPYQSIKPFIAMLADAAKDPEVVSIKMTLYRVATDSKIIEALINAAENGKEVVTIVELRARFDEQNNIDWSKALEKAGCTVIYGYEDYKVHSKLTLITKKNANNKFSYISQIGTGNYNEKTSELYTDLSYITTNQATGEEVSAVFNNLALARLTSDVSNLIVAPLCFKSVLMAEIDAEIKAQQNGKQSSIILKCNSLSDKDIINKISQASNFGVRTDMIIRGICCMKAGVPELSQNVHIRSIVGRYLEHSRIYAFGKGDNLRIYIASGDFLTRNTERRLEVGIKITNNEIRQKLYNILNLQLNDNVNAQIMGSDGRYKKVTAVQGQVQIDSQSIMYSVLSTEFEDDTQLQSNPIIKQKIPQKETQKIVPKNNLQQIRPMHKKQSELGIIKNLLKSFIKRK